MFYLVHCQNTVNSTDRTNAPTLKRYSLRYVLAFFHSYTYRSRNGTLFLSLIPLSISAIVIVEGDLFDAVFSYPSDGSIVKSPYFNRWCSGFFYVVKQSRTNGIFSCGISSFSCGNLERIYIAAVPDLSNRFLTHGNPPRPLPLPPE